MKSTMKDKYDREINYLRVSLTDRCNLKCVYCMPERVTSFEKEEDNLTKEEILNAIDIFAQLGITKVRLTGGEPLLRKDFYEILKEINRIEGINHIALTTNGIYLEDKLEYLKENGVKSINVSLDSLNNETFNKLTRGGDLLKVLKGIEKAINLGIKVKINTVIIQGVNDKEIDRLANLTSRYNVDVRFIELMPIGEGINYIGIDESIILKELNIKFGDLIKLDKENEVANYYKIEGAKGRIGFISPMTNHFCNTCNRIRITSNGFIKQCLHSSKGVNVKGLLKGDYSKDRMVEIIKSTIYNKPKAHRFNEDKKAEDKRLMYQIGG